MIPLYQKMNIIFFWNYKTQFFHQDLSGQPHSSRKHFKKAPFSCIRMPTGQKMPKTLIIFTALGFQAHFIQNYQPDFLHRKCHRQLLTYEWLFKRKLFDFISSGRILIVRSPEKLLIFLMNLDFQFIFINNFCLWFLLQGPNQRFQREEDFDKNLSFFSFCRNLDTRKMPQRVYDLYKPLHSSSFFTTCFNPPAKVSISSFVVETDFSESLSKNFFCLHSDRPTKFKRFLVIRDLVFGTTRLPVWFFVAKAQSTALYSRRTIQ